MLQKCYEAVIALACALAPACAFVYLCALSLVYTRVGELEAASCELGAARESKLDYHYFEGGTPMNSLSNNIRISDLPNYIKTSAYHFANAYGGMRAVVPELNCHWSEVRRSYPFILAITGNIATAETFPYNRKEYRRTGDCFSFTRRANYRGGEFRGWHQLSFTFEILEKIATGEQVAIIRDVVRGGPVY